MSAEPRETTGLERPLKPLWSMRSNHEFAASGTQRYIGELERYADALLDRLEKAEAALEWFASEEAWEITPGSIADGRYRFNTTRESVCATPWGFARAALAAPAPDKEPDG